MISQACRHVVLVWWLAAAAWGATYYVSTTRGNDHNSGQARLTPWRSIARVNRQQFRPGDVIRLERGGEWHDSLKLSSSGAKNQPITVTAYGTGPRPVLSNGPVNIDNNEQSHIVYDSLDLRDAQQGLRLYSWSAAIADITLQNSVIATRAGERPPKMSAGVYASAAKGSLSNIVIRNNLFYPDPRRLENWGVYFVRSVTDFRIENNFFSPAGEDAITVWHCGRGAIVHNRGGGNGENTIDIKDSRDVWIWDNIAVNDREYNIVIHRVDPGPDTTNILVTANHCIGGGLGGKLTAGIALLDVQASKLIGNQVEKSAGEAILVRDGQGGGRNQIRGNFLRRNGILRPSEAIVIQGDSRTTVEDNDIRP